MNLHQGSPYGIDCPEELFRTREPCRVASEVVSVR